MSWLSTGEAPEFAEGANFGEDGKLVVQEIKTQKLEVGSQEKPEGVTIHDQIIREPKCVVVAGDVVKVEQGACGNKASAAEEVPIP